MQEIFVSNICSWMPPEDDPGAAPKLEFTEPIFRRRLSRLSRMTVQVVHELFAAGTDRNTKIVFASRRGEIERQFKVNKTLIQDNAVMPASFSLSTFNAPVALAAIAENLKGGYTAVYASHGNFNDTLLMASAPVLCGKEKQVAFVYADELIPEDYKDFMPEDNRPLAFSALLSSQKTENAVLCNIAEIKTPQDFLKVLKG